MAADYGDALGYSEQVFEDQAESVQKWVTNNSVALRINKSELQKHVNDMGSLYRSFGIGTKKAAELSEGLVKLATDLRAATGDNTSDIIQSLTSVMTGGYRAGYKYGIVINEAAIQTKALSMGLIEQGESLTQAQKELVIYELIMEQTAQIQGQGAKEAGNYKSQLDALKTTFDNLKISIGEKLLPVATDLITRANEFFESDAGKELLDSITKSVENISNKVQEMLKDGKLEEWMNNLKEKIPNIVDGVSDFTDKIIKLLPKIEDLTDKLLALFGIESESEKAKQALYDNRKAIEELAKSYDTSVDTIKTALVAFCEEEGYTLSEVVNNWDDYLPEIENYLNRIKNSYTEDFSSMWTTIASFAQENGKSVKEICQNWSTYEPQIIEYASKMGNDYSQKFTESLNTLQNFDQENNRELGDVLTDWQNNDIALVDEMNQFVSNTASMEDSVIQEISKLGPDSQSAIDSAVSSINTSSWDTFWRGVKQTASDVWSFIKTATSPSAWENSGFSLSGGARAAGGPVLPGRMYQVNDDHARRIEAFVPAVPGYILNGNDTQKVINNSTNNSRSFGDVNIYVSNYGGNIDQLADKLGQAVSQRRRIAGAW